jgi:hypothetical protein
VISAEALTVWLRDQLGRADLARHVESLMADESLGDDLRLLHLVHSLWPQMPPIWRGRSIDRANVLAAASAARNGAAEDTEWLETLANGRALEFFAQHGRADILELSDAWNETRSSYSRAWEALVRLGVPNTSVPEANRQLAVTAMLTFSADYREALRREARRLLDPADWLLRAPWYLAFGSDPARMTDAQLEALHQLDTVSLMESVQGSTLNELGQIDLDRLRRGVFVTDAQRRLLQRMEVAAGGEVIVLRPGQQHLPPLARNALVEAVQAMWGWVRRQWAWLRTQLRRSEGADTPATSTSPEQPSAPVVHFELRMARVAPNGEQPLRDIEAFVARLSWRTPSDSQHRLVVTSPGWPRIPLLTTGLLPSEGQVLFMLNQSSRFQLVRRVALFRWERSEPIVVRLPPKASLIGSGRRMTIVPRSAAVRANRLSVGLLTHTVRPQRAASGSVGQTPAPTLRAPEHMNLGRRVAFKPAVASDRVARARPLTEVEIRVAHWMNWPTPRSWLERLETSLRHLARQVPRLPNQHGRR